MSRCVMLTACVFLLLLAAGCGDVGSLFARPDATISNISPGEITTRAAQLVFDIDITNPYQAALPLTNVDYALSTDGTKFLSGQADMQGSIPAGATKTVQLPIDVPYVEVYQAVKGAMGKSEIPYVADLGLSVDAPVVGRLRLPTSKEGTLKLPTTDSALDFLRSEIQKRTGG